LGCGSAAVRGGQEDSFLTFTSNCNVDDFQVPGDHGYGYDNYGVGKALTREYIVPLVSQFELSEFYPRTPSSVETGGRRGSASAMGVRPGVAHAVERSNGRAGVSVFQQELPSHHVHTLDTILR
jgi:hypothetical protein